MLEADITAFDAVRLTAMTEETLQSWFADFTLPLLGERVMRLRELGAALLEGSSCHAASRLLLLALCVIIVSHHVCVLCL